MATAQVVNDESLQVTYRYALKKGDFYFGTTPGEQQPSFKEHTLRTALKYDTAADAQAHIDLMEKGLEDTGTKASMQEALLKFAKDNGGKPSLQEITDAVAKVPRLIEPQDVSGIVIVRTHI